MFENEHSLHRGLFIKSYSREAYDTGRFVESLFLVDEYLVGFVDDDKVVLVELRLLSIQLGSIVHLERDPKVLSILFKFLLLKVSHMFVGKDYMHLLEAGLIDQSQQREDDSGLARTRRHHREHLSLEVGRHLR